MALFGRILAPVEFSDRCAGSVRYAAAMAKHLGSELIVVHVVPPPGPETSEEAYRVRCAEAELRLNAFAQEEAGTTNRRIVLKGDPARKIVQFAQDERADVILMATHWFGPFRRFILGSNTAKVLHDADCPVWTGAHLEETSRPAPAPPRQVLCAVDLGPQSGTALGCAAALQKDFGCRLTVMHVTPEFSSLVKGSGGNWNATVRSAAGKEVSRLCEESGITPGVVIETGEPAQEIAAAVHRLTADLLVIGRGSASGVFGRLRTNAYAIIRQSPCPVLSI